MAEGLRLIVYDATQRRRKPAALGLSWQYGSYLYRALERSDASYGARSFADALAWLARHDRTRPIRELQFWGHGKWGRIFIDCESLDRRVLHEAHPHYSAFRAFRERLEPRSLIWMRTCETLGASAGHDFAAALADATGARVAGHTFVIGFFQSGLHCLAPGARPHGSPSEGLASGTPEAPRAAHGSHPSAPNTITCLHGEVPEGY
jgi:hypothetical protein